MSVQYDQAGQPTADASDVTTTLGAAALGGTISVRVIVDDAVVTNRKHVLLALESIAIAIRKQTWPAS